MMLPFAASTSRALSALCLYLLAALNARAADCRLKHALATATFAYLASLDTQTLAMLLPEPAPAVMTMIRFPVRTPDPAAPAHGADLPCQSPR